MADELVLDASVAVKLFIDEVGSDTARALVDTEARFVAPDLVLVELANVAAKRLRRGEISRALAERIIVSSRSLFRELAPAAGLTDRAFALAADHGLSTYDAMYVALAEARSCDLVTADARLMSRAAQARLAVTIRAP
jgi:predicted nucleic acid-binding protein